MISDEDLARFIAVSPAWAWSLSTRRGCPRARFRQTLIDAGFTAGQAFVLARDWFGCVLDGHLQGDGDED